VSSERSPDRLYPVEERVKSLPEVPAITRATVRRALASPIGLLVAAGACSAWALYSSFGPIGIRSQDRDRDRLIYEFAFMAGALGVALGAAARKKLSPWIESFRPLVGLLADAVAIATSGLLLALLSVSIPFAFSRGSGSGVTRALPLLFVASAWGVVAIRIAPRSGASGWIAALGSFALPALLPETHVLPRAISAAAALLLCAWLLDHPPEGFR